MSDLSGDKMIALFKQHLNDLREGHDAVSAHIAASQEAIEQSRALIVQIDEQISRMERELGWFGGHARRGPGLEQSFDLAQGLFLVTCFQNMGKEVEHDLRFADKPEILARAR